ncbi:MAG: AAA family ATPase [Armatimonadetes bacterium]|nr:AAA family ATPase [Armatimonadota bacterium]
MLTKLTVKGFKCLDDVEIDLGQAVVFIGPNNSGKTVALQALALWHTGLQQWLSRRRSRPVPDKRPGVTLNRRDLIAVPVPDAKLLWHDLHIRDVEMVLNGQGKLKPKTKGVLMEVTVSAVSAGHEWECGLEFDYANPESFYCRPLRRPGPDGTGEPMNVPEEASGVRVAFLPPMSGLAAEEPKWEPGRVNVLIGEGQTAQVLRNLCHQLHEAEGDRGSWADLAGHIEALFGQSILPPRYDEARGEVTMVYRERSGVELDISSSGRGLQQTLLLLAYLYAHPGTVLLLDEPDAHLEILRQRQTYRLIKEVAASTGSQVIAASHSEVVLNEAADSDVVVAFVGLPHRIDDRKSQVLKALKDIGFEDYYLAEHLGWVLYLEGPTDLAILQSFARLLDHDAVKCLARPLVRYVQNQPSRARSHFFGLREAKSDLVGIALFDRLQTEGLSEHRALREVQWQKRELENYLCRDDVLLAWARGGETTDLWANADAQRREDTMRRCIENMERALATMRRPGPWSDDIKATDDFLDPLFEAYFEALGLPILFGKSDYHQLTEYMTPGMLPDEVTEKLDAIAEVAERATPRQD